jgi:polyferredoxin
VDIRDGLQLGCIQCGLCIDACDNVMKKVSRPTGLIGYDTDLNLRRRLEGKPDIWRIVRPRTLLYAGLIAVVGTLMLGTLATRSDVGVNVMHDRNPLFVRLSDGSIRNGFTIRILNKELVARSFALSVEGLPGAHFEVIGAMPVTSGHPVVEVGPDRTQEVRLLVTARGSLPPQASVPLTVRVTDIASGQTAEAHDHFRGP